MLNTILDRLSGKKSSNKQVVEKIFMSVTGLPAQKLDFSKALSAYQIDSIKMIELVVELEKIVGKVPLADIQKFRCLDDIVNYINHHQR